MADHFVPKRNTERNTTRVESDIGIGPMGMEIGASIHMTAVMSAQVHRRYVVIFGLLFCFTFSVVNFPSKESLMC